VAFSGKVDPQSLLILFKAQKGKSGAFGVAFQKSMCFAERKAIFTWTTSPEKVIMKTGLKLPCVA
jgi:hypothetical protein